MKDMELYDSFIRETTDLLGAPTQKWAYKERDAWKDNGESELVLLRDAAYELGGGANDAVNFTCVTSDSSLVPADDESAVTEHGRQPHVWKGHHR